MCKNYQQNEISYCVNHKGQKIKPYKSLPTIQKPTLLKQILNFFKI
jgi:hypothetical protein